MGCLYIDKLVFLPISGRVDRASATKTVDLGLIPSQVKQKTKKIGVYSFSICLSVLLRTV